MLQEYIIARNDDHTLNMVWDEKEDCLVKMKLYQNETVIESFDDDFSTACYLIDNGIVLVDEVNYFFSDVINDILN